MAANAGIAAAPKPGKAKPKITKGQAKALAKKAAQARKKQDEQQDERLVAHALRQEQGARASKKKAKVELTADEQVKQWLDKQLSKVVQKEAAAEQAAQKRAAASAEKAEQQAALQLEAQLRLVAPSDLAGTTGSRNMLELLRLSAVDVVAEFPSLATALAPMLGDDPAGGVAALAKALREALAEGYAAAVQAGGKSEGRCIFLAHAASPELQRRLYDCIAPAPGEQVDEDLGPALFALARAAVGRYYELNARASPAPAAAPAEAEDAALDDEERGVVMYLAGWAVRQELARANREAKAAVPLLQQLLLPAGEQLPKADGAVQYVEARELHGGLLRVRMSVTTWFVAVEAIVRRELTMEQLLLQREQLLQRCSAALKTSSLSRTFAQMLTLDAECKDALDALVHELARRLWERYLHARAAAFRKEVMQTVSAQKKQLAIRAALKASHGGKPKKKSEVPFSRAVLGTLPAAALHGLLVLIATTKPESLDCLIKSEMSGLLTAYDKASAELKGVKADLHTQLVGAILSHEKFACEDDPKLFKLASVSVSQE